MVSRAKTDASRVIAIVGHQPLPEWLIPLHRQLPNAGLIEERGRFHLVGAPDGGAVVVGAREVTDCRRFFDRVAEEEPEFVVVLERYAEIGAEDSDIGERLVARRFSALTVLISYELTHLVRSLGTAHDSGRVVRIDAELLGELGASPCVAVAVSVLRAVNL